MDEKEIRERIDSVPFWWHSIPIGDQVTPGMENEVFRFLTPNFQDWVSQIIPEDLTGLSVLDVGAWDGYASFLAEKRGAKRVLAIDRLACRHKVTNLDAFWTAHELLGSRVQIVQMDVYDIDRLEEQFDLILFFGVLYHLKHPLLALEKLYDRTRGHLLIETHVSDGEEPRMTFYEGSEYGGDPTNWWGPTMSLVEAMCRTSGFSSVERVDLLEKEGSSERRALFRAAK